VEDKAPWDEWRSRHY